MDKKIFGTVAAVLLVAALCGCLIYSYSADKQKPIPELLPGEPEASATTSLAVIPSVLDDVGATPQGKGKVSASNNKFAFDLYSRLKGQDGNLFFSPFSISSMALLTIVMACTTVGTPIAITGIFIVS